MHKIGQSRGFLGRDLEPLLKSELPLIGNVQKPLAKKVLIPLGLTEAASATNAAIYKKYFGSGLLIKSFNKTIKNEAKEQKGGFLSIIGTLGASLLGNLLRGKGSIRVGEGHLERVKA